MTREEEVARLAEIEAQPHSNPKFKATFRAFMERGWMLEDAGVIDMWWWKSDRMVERVNKALGREG